MLERILIVGLWAVCGLAATSIAQIQTITFDDIPAGVIGDQYLARGVRFLRGNGAFGQSTGPRTEEGQLQSASVGNFGTAITPPNVLVPGPGSNDDIWVYFYDSKGDRTTITSFGVSNDREGNPSRVYLDGFDADGTLLIRSHLDGAAGFATALYPGIAAARISAGPEQSGYLGVDEFIFCPTPEIIGQPIDQRECRNGAVIFSVDVFRPGAAYLWQAADSNPNEWTDLRRDGALIVDGMDVGQITGTGTSRVTLRSTGADGARFDGLIRVIVSSPCGAVVTIPAPMRICAGDYNCDGGVDGLDVDVFFADWSDGRPESDINGDGGVDGSDVSFFFTRWEGGC